MPCIIANIHALGEAQKEIATSVKKLKDSIPKPSEKINEKDYAQQEKTTHEESTIAT